jgi:NRAMP (natural resistance-associated macrophage protein)-like metal ion transporter
MKRAARRRLAIGGLFAVVGPGLIAGLSDDDPAGITTYSVLGAQHGYQLLWVLALSIVALILFHGLGARMGVVTGQGIIGLVRQRYGVKLSGAALVALVLANLGTTCAEFAGLAAGFELFGVSRYLSVPLAAFGVSALVLRGSFRRIEHIFVLLAAVFVAYIASGLLSHPDWGAAVHGLVVPTMPFTRDAFVIITATVGTTLAPWGLAFIQSYAVDKQLRPEDLRFERIDVIAGSILTGVVGFFVIVACAATLHRNGLSIDNAADAARGLEPLAGGAAGTLFGIGLVGAAVLAASILPLSTAYSVCEYIGVEAALNDPYAEAKPFYVTYGVVVVFAAVLVLLPGAPLVTILVATQVLNAVLLIPLLVFLLGVARDRDLMGEWVATRRSVIAYSVTIAVVSACVIGLIVTMVV